MEILFIVAAITALGSAALLWGANSNDGIDSPEWERRHNWRGFRSHTR